MREASALYRLFSHGGELLYLGVSICAFQRIYQHHQATPWFDEVAIVKLEWHANKRAALDAERIAIEKESPKFNVMYKKIRPGKSRKLVA